MKNDFDLLIIGAGAAGLSCAILVGSGLSKEYAEGRKAGIFLHQKTSHLQSALLNNALGVNPGTPGKEILESGTKQLQTQYPQVVQIAREKVTEIRKKDKGYLVISNKYEYFSKQVVVAVGYTDSFIIKGLEPYIIPHQKAKVEKSRIQLKNEDHLVAPGLYVAGTLAGHRSQFAIACGSGAAVATDILTSWNDGEHTKVHDKYKA